MKIVCIPIVEDRGVLSPVSHEFATAPLFLLVDTATLAFRAVPNTPQRQRSRGCDPCGALQDTTVDLVLVSCIELETLEQITRRGVPVHGGASGTVADALAAFIGGKLPSLHADPEVGGAIVERVRAAPGPRPARLLPT